MSAIRRSQINKHDDLTMHDTSIQVHRQNNLQQTQHSSAEVVKEPT